MKCCWNLVGLFILTLVTASSQQHINNSNEEEFNDFNPYDIHR